MSLETATALLYAHKPIVEDRGGELVVVPFEEARARYPQLVAERRALARAVAEEVGRS